MSHFEWRRESLHQSFWSPPVFRSYCRKLLSTSRPFISRSSLLPRYLCLTSHFSLPLSPLFFTSVLCLLSSIFCLLTFHFSLFTIFHAFPAFLARPAHQHTYPICRRSAIAALSAHSASDMPMGRSVLLPRGAKILRSSTSMLLKTSTTRSATLSGSSLR